MYVYRTENHTYSEVLLINEESPITLLLERLRLLTTPNVSGSNISDKGADMKSPCSSHFIKVVEPCPISGKGIMSFYTDSLGGVFYNQYHDFAMVIPPEAVSQGDCVEIQATASYWGPYTIPDGFYPISSYFWVSANYIFKNQVYLIMSHYAKIRSLEDISNLHVLHNCAQESNANGNYPMSRITDGDPMSRITDGVYFDMKIRYCVLATDHFCSYCQAKSVKHIPEYLLACYCTYDDDSSDHRSFVAEVCFCPSNIDCKKVTQVTFYYLLTMNVPSGIHIYAWFIKNTFPKNVCVCVCVCVCACVHVCVRVCVCV